MRFIISFLFCLLLRGYIAFAQEIKIVATRVIQGPVVDGRLNDPVWDSAISFSGFRMVEPVPGSEPLQKQPSINRPFIIPELHCLALVFIECEL